MSKFDRYVIAALAALLVVLSFFIGVAIARAEGPYVYGALGRSSSNLADKPGLWQHEGQPDATNMADMAFKAGMGTRFESGFFIEAGMIDPGAFVIQSQFTVDGNYNEKTGQCERKCGALHALNLQNDMLGGEAVVGYQYALLDYFRPYAKVGIAGFSLQSSETFYKHGPLHLPGIRNPPQKPRHFDSERNMGQNFSGMIMAVAFGGGVCAPVAKVELCGDVTRYHYIATTANPLTDGLTVSTAYLKVQLTGWLN